MIYDLLRMKISDDVKLSSGWVLSRTNRENENISMVFDLEEGSLLKLVDKLSSTDLIGAAANSVSLFDFKFVGENGELIITTIPIAQSYNKKFKS
jgi:hypothetical protein